MDEELLRTLKAFADVSRLRILGNLAYGRRVPAAELASSLGLPRPTVARHLRRLEEAGLIDARPQLRPWITASGSSGFRGSVRS